jgi:23S rRNA pseudouridine1911/1915/1917 synthase
MTDSTDNDLIAGGDDSEDLFERLTIVADKGQEPFRIDKFLMNRIEGATRNKIQQAIEEGRILVNEQQVKPNYKVKALDKIVVYDDRSPDYADIVPEEIPLDIVYEDDAILVINKPAGLVVHPGSGNHHGTLVNGVAFHLQQLNPEVSEKDLPRFGLVHRIDKNTSGLLVLAKNNKALQHLSKQFYNHTVERKYIALVWGDMKEDSGTVNAHIGRHLRYRKLFEAYPEGDHGKEAITHYKVLERFGYVTLIECQLETGRTHQIRVHMKHLGHPLFNDEFYGGDKIVKGTIFSKYRMFVDNSFIICARHALHAKTLGFIHPNSGDHYSFDSDLAEDMEEVIERWRRYAKAKGI